MQNTAPTPGSKWRHYKSSEWDERIYQVIGIAYHSETDEPLVIYKPLYEVQPTSCIYWKSLLARPLSMWFDMVEYDWKQMQRFTEIE